MRETLTAALFGALVFVTTAASANFILGNASKYDLHFQCTDQSFDIPVGAKPVTIPYNTKQKKHSIAFSYLDSATKQPLFQGVVFGKVVCTTQNAKSCSGTISFKEKSFVDFIEIYGQNKAGNVNLVFDDLPPSKVKSK